MSPPAPDPARNHCVRCLTERSNFSISTVVAEANRRQISVRYLSPLVGGRGDRGLPGGAGGARAARHPPHGIGEHHNDALCSPLTRHGASIKTPFGAGTRPPRRRASAQVIGDEPAPVHFRNGLLCIKASGPLSCGMVALATVHGPRGGAQSLSHLNDAPCPPFTSHGASIMLQ
jgi:hypothetical protein